jgi:hypothetical protein
MSDAPRAEASIGLAELISAVRSELELVDASRLDRSGESLLELREVELEIQFEVTKAKNDVGDLEFHVVAVSSDPSDAPPAAGHQRLRVLYGPAFRLVELEEGESSSFLSSFHRASET